MKTLKMAFVNEGGGTLTLSVRNPKDNITETEVQTVMDNIINKNVFATTDGDLVAKKWAKVVDTTETVLYEAE